MVVILLLPLDSHEVGAAGVTHMTAMSSIVLYMSMYLMWTTPWLFWHAAVVLLAMYTCKEHFRICSGFSLVAMLSAMHLCRSLIHAGSHLHTVRITARPWRGDQVDLELVT